MKSLTWGGMKFAGLAMWTSPGLTGTWVAETIAVAETKAKIAKEISCMTVRDIKEVEIAEDELVETCSGDFQKLGEGSNTFGISS